VSNPVGVHRLNLVAVVEVGRGVLFPEEQPVSSGVAQRPSFLQEAAEGAMPVPGPIMIIGVEGSLGGRKLLDRRT